MILKKKLLGIIKSKVKSTKFPDYFSGGIFKMSDFNIKGINNDLVNDINDIDNKKKICNIEGAFLDEIMFDDKVYYSFDNKNFTKIVFSLHDETLFNNGKNIHKPWQHSITESDSKKFLITKIIYNFV